MEKQNLPPEMTEVLTTSHFAYLCTTDLNNQPHITPMFYVFDEKTNDLYVTASSGSKKFRTFGQPEDLLNHRHQRRGESI
jgi:nitroimidazol reductase NimA-like FMN-containing flavoprotein (pyridoxamine 5'-phosphate oxidase superfamily)